MLRCIIKIDEYHSAYILIEVTCPNCKSIMLLLGPDNIKGQYNMRCDACQKIVPPINRMIKEESQRITWHKQHWTNCYGETP